MELNTIIPPALSVIGVAIGALVGLIGVNMTQKHTSAREFRLRLWELRSQTYVDLLGWTGWVEHWYIAGRPDKYERPHTVDMARIAARLRAFDDKATGDKASRLLEELIPYVSRQDISDHQPPPVRIRELARELTERARWRLASESFDSAQNF
ncbi:hypothetical protein [Arthrobacter mobilis]|uniref:Uncharacterized protein n=1 Tax=Arthrobacter mobilis TaxID=2724944 RepID=A0A7X6K4B4_9MICC|nr:hypothetical protein [Arthrobacter mobilis]NKX53034.1 hypothetical protein [Arthrobacter mobilis]